MHNTLGLSKSSTVILAFAILFVISVVLILWITPLGAGVSPDSTVYIKTAQNLLSGQGYTFDGQPFSWYPPLYPAILAAFGFLLKDFVQAARLLGALLFGVNITLVGVIVHQATGRNLLAATLAMLFTAASAAILEMHSMAFSEPAFITLTLAGLLLLIMYVRRPGLALLVSSALAIGLGCLTRYIGIAFIPAGVLVIIWGERKLPARDRLLFPLLWLALAGLPLAIFVIRTWLFSASVGPGAFSAHPVPLAEFLSRSVITILNYILPLPQALRYKLVFLGGFGILAAFLLVRAYHKHWAGAHWYSITALTAGVSSLFFISYLIFLYLSMSYFAASTPVDARLLSPVFFLLTIAVFSFVAAIARPLRAFPLWGCFLLLAVLLTGLKLPSAVTFAKAMRLDGLGYTSRAWRSSATISFLNTHRVTLKIYSNGSDALGFLTTTDAVGLPMLVNTSTTQANPNYLYQLAAMCDQLSQGNALVLYFSTIQRSFFPTPADVIAACKVPVLFRFSDSIIYGVPR